MTPYHDVDDAAKVDALAASMKANGWVGPPLVAWYSCLITGVHRFAAVEKLEQEGIFIDIPTVDIRDLAEIEGKDFDAICTEEGCDGIDSPALIYVLDRVVSQQMRDEYGIDVH